MPPPPPPRNFLKSMNNANHGDQLNLQAATKRHAFPKLSTSSKALFLLPLLLLAFIYLFVYPKRFQSSLATCNSTPTSTSTQLANAYTAKPAADLRLLLGVLTRAGMYERRALLRLAYALQSPPDRAVIDVRFVVCNLTKEEDAALVALEIIAHGDIIVLNCTENMDNGKTYTYFSTIPQLFADVPYDYVGKTDDDTYYRLGALADTLRTKARHDMYYGFLTPCHRVDYQYMSGMGYIVSWDVAAWISATDELRNDMNGPEDLVLGRWLQRGGKGKNKYGAEPQMYDYWDGGMLERVNCFRHALAADTVAVHKLKDRLKWARTLNFFNATRGLKPSELYHVDL